MKRMRFQRAADRVKLSLADVTSRSERTEDRIEGVSLNPDNAVKLLPPVKLKWSTESEASITPFSMINVHIPYSPLLQAHAGRLANGLST
jgi:hypothetical protein